MKTSLRIGLAGRRWCRRAHSLSVPRMAWLVLVLTMLSGCGRHAPQATVEGTLRLDGRPLDRCLVTFLPNPGQEGKPLRSTGLTDRQGSYRLCFDNQEEGAAIGWHRVTIEDLSVSTGVRRRDHGTVDEEVEETTSRPSLRRSRVPERYTSATDTPLLKEVKAGHQVIDLEIK